MEHLKEIQQARRFNETQRVVTKSRMEESARSLNSGRGTEAKFKLFAKLSQKLDNREVSEQRLARSEDELLKEIEDLQTRMKENFVDVIGILEGCDGHMALN